jgi:hypothetical protein
VEEAASEMMSANELRVTLTDWFRGGFDVGNTFVGFFLDLQTRVNS